MPDDLLSELLISMRFIWKTRNDNCFQKKTWTPMEVHNATTVLLKWTNCTHHRCIDDDPTMAPNPNQLQGINAPIIGDEQVQTQDTTMALDEVQTHIHPLGHERDKDHVQTSRNTQGMTSLLAGIAAQINPYFISLPSLIQGIRCFSDASLTPNQSSQLPRSAGIGIFFVNP